MAGGGDPLTAPIRPARPEPPARSPRPDAPDAARTRGARAAGPGGRLTSEQQLEWEAPWPQHLAASDIAALLERAHFRSVERFSLGLVRCRRSGGRVVCALPGGVVALTFEDAGTVVSGQRVERRWRIGGGMLARRPVPAPPPRAPLPAPADDAGTLAIGLAAVEAGRLRAWLRVSGFPSRFLAPLPARPRLLRWLRLPWAALGAVYTLYHAQAAHSCLRCIARLTAGHMAVAADGANVSGQAEDLRSEPAVAGMTRPQRADAPAPIPPVLLGRAGPAGPSGAPVPPGAAVLLTGATGFVGRELWPALERAGYRVRGLTRQAAAARRRWPHRDWVQADLDTAGDLRPLLRGCDAAFYLVHSMRSGRADFRRVEVEQAARFAAAAAAAGVRRIVYLGGVVPAGEPSEHLRSRLDVGEVLRAGAVPAIELRASMIVGAGSVSWMMVRDLAARLPAMVLPRWLRSRTDPVAVDDVVAALAGALALPLERSAWFDIPGADRLTGRAILEQTAEALGLRPPLVLEVPVLSPWLSSHWVRLVTRADWSIARELVLGLGSDLVAQDARYWGLIGYQRQTPFREAARRALASERDEAPPAGAGAALERLVARWRRRSGG